MSDDKELVDAVFGRLAAGEISLPVEGESSGWETTLPSGKKVLRSTLENEAKPLIALGAKAVPHLLPWAANENAALRYAAIYTLQQITGETPYVPYFDQADAEGHRARAIEVWRKWFENQPK